MASDFVFVYNDGFSYKYKGDIGLKYAMFNDTLTGCCYHMSQDLTAKQKMYFDDYDTQLYRYYEDQKIKEMRNMEGYMADIESEIDYQNSKNDKQKNGGTFSGYTSRSGYIYGRYY